MANDQLEILLAERTAQLTLANERLESELAELRRTGDELRSELTQRKQTEDQLRTSERLYRTLAQNFPNGGVALFDRELRYMIAEGVDLARIGLSKDALEGKTIWEAFSPEVSRLLEPVYRRALAGASTVEEVPLRGRVYLRHAVPIADEHGEIVAGMVMSQDITERKRSERGLRLLQTITSLISQAEDLESALQVALRTVCEATGWILGQAWTPSRDGTALGCISAWHSSDQDLEAFRASSEETTFLPGIGLPGRVWISKRAAWVPDVTDDPNFPRAASARVAGLKAAVGIPVLAGDEVVLVMEFFVRQLREEDEDLIKLISAVAAELGLVIQSKRAEEALRRKEFECRNLIESVQAIVWRADASTFQFSFVSKEAEMLLGYPTEQWVDDPTFWSEHIHPEDRQWAVSLCMRATEDNRDHQFQYRMIAADGRVVWLRDIVRVVEDGGVKELVGVMVDITDQKLAEEAASRNEKKFAAIFQTIPDVVSIMRVSDGLMLDLNDAWATQTGYLKSERIGKTAQELNLYSDQTARQRLTEQLLETGEVNNYEATYRIRNGSLRTGLTSARVIELDGEKCVIGITRDITDFRAAEKAVRRSEETFRTLAETTPSAIVVHRFDEARILYVNPAMEDISGYSQAELQRLTMWDLIHPDSVAIVSERRLARLRGERVSPRLELKLITKSGEVRWVDQSIGTIEFEGEPALIVTAFDITDRKCAEEALRQSEERYRLIVENQTEFIVKWTPDGTRTFLNESYCRYFGISEEQCIGTSFFPLVAPEFREAIRRKTASLTPDAPEYTEEHLSMVTGGQRWQQWTNRGIFDADGKLIELLSTGRDITKRKIAEEALQESERRGRRLNERFSLAVESAGIGVWDLNLIDRQLTWDQQMYLLYKVPPAEFSGAYEAWERGVHPDDLPRVDAEVQQAINGLRAFDTDFRAVWPDGEARHIKAFARVVCDDDGAPVRMTGINYDITDRKRAEEALKQSEAHYRALVENTPDIIARFDRDCRYLFVNSAVAQVSELRPEDFVGKSLREAGFSDEQADFREAVIRSVFETRDAFETEFEFDGRNGPGIFEWRVYPEFDQSGAVRTVLSINRDVTERRLSEAELRRSREQLRALSSHLQTVREEERTHIAREVHDELGQALTALKIDLYALQRGLSRGNDPNVDRLTEKIKSMSGLIDATIHSVRRIATELRPGILDDLGLVAAIEWQANDFQTRTGIKCEVTASVDYLELDRDRSTAAFRILQETLTNVARHASASRVGIELKRDDRSLVLEVRDNGKGITASELSGSKSLGLLGMRERAQLFGGDLRISGAAGNGTRVIVNMPL